MKLLSTFFLALLSLPASANTFRVGVGPGCNYDTLERAIEVTARRNGADVILVNQGAIAPGRHLVIEAQDLTIIGGMSDCSDSEPGYDKTVISGGGAGGSVFVVGGGGVVELANLHIVGGNDPAVGGGGIRFTGSESVNVTGSLTLREVTLEGNRGRNGGGLLFKAIGGIGARLTLLEGVSFLDNVAAEYGGGLALYGHASLVAKSERLFLHRNRAGGGGGIYAAQPASGVVGSAQYNGYVTFLGNTAFHGGALYLSAPFGRPTLPSRFSFFSIVPDRPMTIADNGAYGSGTNSTGRGGAFFVDGAHTVDGYSATLCLDAVNVTGNAAGDGAVAYLSGAYFGRCGRDQWFQSLRQNRRSRTRSRSCLHIWSFAEVHGRHGETCRRSSVKWCRHPARVE